MLGTCGLVGGPLWLCLQSYDYLDMHDWTLGNQASGINPTNYSISDASLHCVK